ncbi:MAG: ABC transporter ATP-binding protein/permease [Akkermansiaceae bacterium]|nr:ABC transporter ATP-binding protein/permease [Akkermansiaceae bacterium]
MTRLKTGVFADHTHRKLIGRVLRENFRLYVGRYLLAFLMMVGVAAATGVSALLLQTITEVIFKVSTAVPGKRVPGGGIMGRWLRDLQGSWTDWFKSAEPGMLLIVEVSVVVVVVFLVKGVCQYVSQVILARIGNNIVARQQQRISNHILNQSLTFLVHFPTADLIQRVSRAATSTRDVMNLMMLRVQDLLTAVGLITVMFITDWRLSMVTLFIMAPIVMALGSIIRRIRKIAHAEFQSSIRVVNTVQEAIIGNKLIKSYNLEPHMTDRFDEAIHAVEKRANKMASVSARTSPLMESVGGIAIACMVCYGGYRNLLYNESPGSLLTFLAAMLLAYEPVKRIAKMNVTLHASLIGVQMLYEVLDSNYQIPDHPEARPLKLTQGDITLREVTFSYRPGLPVVHGISLACPGGGVTALVGPSGSGKSTLLNLIERFYAIDSGVIEIDGQDLSRVLTASLRGHLSLVSQDTFLFADTLRNNIRFARPGATDAEVEAAAKAAYAHDFIIEQPQGYDTEVGENGGNLSGGQRQRISIARAFLKNAPILLLDEATSALDSESEQKIQAAFDRLMEGRTTIVIAHRFSTIRNARTIHVMQNGKVVASGSHQDLIADSESLYAHLYRLQYQEG